MTYLSRLKSNGFITDFAKLFGGGTLAQVINFAAIAVISRLYTDYEIGSFAIFVAVVNILGSAITGKYELAIMLPKEERKARNLFFLSITIATWCSLSLLFLISVNAIVGLIPNPFHAHPFLLWLLPLGLLISSVTTSIQNMLNRQSAYSRIANAQLITASATNLLRFPKMIYSNGITGLTFSYFVSQLANLIYLSRGTIKKQWALLTHLRLFTLPKEAREYKQFPFYSMPMTLLNLISVNLLLIVIGYMWGGALTGQYERAFKLIYIPLEMAGAAFSTVFYRRFTLSENKPKMYLTSLAITLIFAALALSPFAFFGKQIATFFLGSSWSVAGKISGLLAPMAIMSFGTRCVSMSFASIGRNKELLAWQVLFLGIMLTWIALGSTLNFYTFISIYAIISGLLYLGLGTVGYFLVKKYAEDEKIN